MSIHDRIKTVVKWLIGQQFGENQEDIGRMLGYTNKSSFSQVVNGKVPLPGDFIERLCSLDSDINKVWIETGNGEMIDGSKIDMRIRLLTLYDQLKNNRSFVDDNEFCEKLGLSIELFNEIRNNRKSFEREDITNSTAEFSKYIEWIFTGSQSPFSSGEFKIPGCNFSTVLKSNDGRYLIPEKMWTDYVSYIKGEHKCSRCDDKDKIINSLEKQVVLLEKQLAVLESENESLKKDVAHQDDNADYAAAK